MKTPNKHVQADQRRQRERAGLPWQIISAFPSRTIHPIQEVDTFHYLGTTLDAKLTFDPRPRFCPSCDGWPSVWLRTDVAEDTIDMTKAAAASTPPPAGRCGSERM